MVCCEEFRESTEKWYKNHNPIIGRDENGYYISKMHSIDFPPEVKYIKFCPFCGKRI